VGLRQVIGYSARCAKFHESFHRRHLRHTIQNGDYDAEARAALTTEDLSEALDGRVVDVYHRTPHAASGTTPANCWNSPKSVSPVGRT
jgi:putative transposase